MLYVSKQILMIEIVPLNFDVITLNIGLDVFSRFVSSEDFDTDSPSLITFLLIFKWHDSQSITQCFI